MTGIDPRHRRDHLSLLPSGPDEVHGRFAFFQVSYTKKTHSGGKGDDDNPYWTGLVFELNGLLV